MIDAGELRRGNILRIDGKLHQVLDFQHQKLGRGSAQVRLRLRDLASKATIERVFQASQRYERVRLDTHHVHYLYQDPSGYHFMDLESYDEVVLSRDEVGEAANYLVDNLELDIVAFEGRPIGVELPVAIDMPVTATEPGLRSDTATTATKAATVASGLQVLVPLFVQTGDVIRIDTRTGQYLTRASQA